MYSNKSCTSLSGNDAHRTLNENHVRTNAKYSSLAEMLPPQPRWIFSSHCSRYRVSSTRTLSVMRGPSGTRSCGLSKPVTSVLRILLIAFETSVARRPMRTVSRPWCVVVKNITVPSSHIANSTRAGALSAPRRLAWYINTRGLSRDSRMCFGAASMRVSSLLSLVEVHELSAIINHRSDTRRSMMRVAGDPKMCDVLSLTELLVCASAG